MLFITAKFTIKWFAIIVSKMLTILEATFFLVVFSSGSTVDMNLISQLRLTKLWIIQTVWQVNTYCFFNKINVGSFIFNIWCTEDPCKRMEMWATPFLKFKAYSIIFCFPQWTINYDPFDKYLNFKLKMPSCMYWVIIWNVTLILII